MSNPARLFSGDGIKITQTSNALDVNIKSGSSGLPSGAATSAKQDTQITAEQAILAKIIAAPATEAKQDSLIAKFGTISDGQAPVVAGYKTKRLSITFTGTGATAQYDAVGALTEIANWASANGRGATLRRAWIEVNNNAIAPQFELHFFNASNPTVAADNATWTSLAADAAKRAGYLVMPVCAKPAGSGTIDIVRAQTPDDFGNSLDMQMTCATESTSLWAALKLLTSGISFADAPGNTITVVMEIEQS